MSLPKLVAGTLLLGSLAIGGVALAGPDALERQSRSVQIASEGEREYGDAVESKMQSMAAIVERLSAEGYGEIREIEREGAHYEVEARDSEGHWLELYVDGATGEVLAIEEDD